MGIQKFGKITLGGNAFAPCNGGRFFVGVTVKGRAGLLPGKFDVTLWDQDFFADDLLTGPVRVNVPGGKGFTRCVNFQLNCDGACDVVGTKIDKKTKVVTTCSSGESSAEVYAYAKEAVGFGANAAVGRSLPFQFNCITPISVKDDGDGTKAPEFISAGGGDDGDDGRGGDLRPGEDGLWGAPCYTLPPEGGLCETQRGVFLDLPARAVDMEVLIPVSVSPPYLETQFFDGDVGLDVQTLQIGRFDTMFHKEIAVRWELDANERFKLEELAGYVVSFDPEEMTWTPMDNVDFDQEAVSFRTTRGGLFGIAPSARFDDLDLTQRLVNRDAVAA